MPARAATPRRHRIARCWDGGIDRRLLLDKICEGSAQALAPHGIVLVVHSDVCNENLTVLRLRASGMRARVVARATVPFGPVMRARAGLLEERGQLEPGRREEDIIVVEGLRD